MSTASIEKIKQLRADLDAPYKDCVEALKNNEDDISKATKWLKEKGRATQRTAQTNAGVIAAYEGSKGVSVVIVRCETDFVAINESFVDAVIGLTTSLNRHTANNEPLDEALNFFKEEVWMFKENIEVKSHLYAPYNDNNVAVYVHHNRNRASIVRYEGGTPESAKKIAMQVCAMSPTHVNRESLNQDEIKQLHDKAKQEALDSKKPEHIAEKIAEGKVNNVLKDYVLLEQPMYDDAKNTVGNFVTQNNLKIISFQNVTI